MMKEKLWDGGGAPCLGGGVGHLTLLGEWRWDGGGAPYLNVRVEVGWGWGTLP